MDNTQHASVDIAIGKAVTANNLRRPTKALQDGIAQGGVNLRLLAVPGVMPLDGGVPIVVDGKNLLRLRRSRQNRTLRRRASVAGSSLGEAWTCLRRSKRLSRGFRNRWTPRMDCLLAALPRAPQGEGFGADSAECGRAGGGARPAHRKQRTSTTVAGDPDVEHMTEGAVQGLVGDRKHQPKFRTMIFSLKVDSTASTPPCACDGGCPVEPIPFRHDR